MKKYTIISLGCPKNLVDSETFAFLAEHNQYSYTEIPEEAELIIINTCGFIESAKEESVNRILETAQLKKTAACRRLIVTGCLVKRYFQDLQVNLPEIDELIDLKDFRSFATLLGKGTELDRKLLTPEHYAYIRISDGCNNLCSYCAIPSIRGSLQSVPLEKLIEEAAGLSARGVKELIVTAQDTALYGSEIYGKPSLPVLLEKLHEVEGIEWIRVLYLHPAHLSSDIIETMGSLPKFCNYFDIPLQHSNDALLQSMNRKVSLKRIKTLLNEIRKTIPGAVIRSSFITGYPGESYHKFNELKNFLQEEQLLRVGVFSYSREEGTPAAEMPGQVSWKTAEKRKDELMAVQQEISTQLLAEFIGKKIKVIIDQKSEYESYKYEGRACFDAPEIDGTVFISEGSAKTGDIVEVEIYDSWEYDLIGNIVK